MLELKICNFILILYVILFFYGLQVFLVESEDQLWDEFYPQKSGKTDGYIFIRESHFTSNEKSRKNKKKCVSNRVFLVNLITSKAELHSNRIKRKFGVFFIFLNFSISKSYFYTRFQAKIQITPFSRNFSVHNFDLN